MKSKIIFLFIPILCVFLCGSSLDTDKIIDEQINIAAESNFFENISEETFEILEFIGIEKPSADIISNLDFSDFFRNRQHFPFRRFVKLHKSLITPEIHTQILSLPPEKRGYDTATTNIPL